MKCKLRALPKSRSETVRDDIRTFFEERKPYDFLQLCYYQVGKHQAAANAAFTNLAVNAEVGKRKYELPKKRVALFSGRGDARESQLLSGPAFRCQRECGRPRGKGAANILETKVLILMKPTKAWTKPYLAGQTAYIDEEWGTMVEAMEESLRLYLKSVPCSTNNTTTFNF